MAELIEIRESVRARYAAAARATAKEQVGCCGGERGADRPMPTSRLPERTASRSSAARSTAPATRRARRSGRRRLARLRRPHRRSRSARRRDGARPRLRRRHRRPDLRAPHGPTGKAIGLDMTDEMLALARANARRRASRCRVPRGLHRGDPLEDASVEHDHLRLCDQPGGGQAPRGRRGRARIEAWGRFAVSDVIAASDIDDATRADMQQWTGCIAGALTEREFRDVLSQAGFEAIEVQPTHAVHEHALGDYPGSQAAARAASR